MFFLDREGPPRAGGRARQSGEDGHYNPPQLGLRPKPLRRGRQQEYHRQERRRALH